MRLIRPVVYFFAAVGVVMVGGYVSLAYRLLHASEEGQR